MRFKAIVCSNCGRARGTRIDAKKVVCNKCGCSTYVKKAKAYYKTDSQMDLAKAVGALNAQMAAKGKLRVIKDLNRNKGPKGSKHEKEIEVLKRFIENCDDMTLEQARIALAEHRGIDPLSMDPDEVLDLLGKMKDMGVLIERRDGLFIRI